jgi:hypothetical protein
VHALVVGPHPDCEAQGHLPDGVDAAQVQVQVPNVHGFAQGDFFCPSGELQLSATVLK